MPEAEARKDLIQRYTYHKSNNKSRQEGSGWRYTKRVAKAIYNMLLRQHVQSRLHIGLGSAKAIS
jgi:hypothetical protein